MVLSLVGCASSAIEVEPEESAEVRLLVSPITPPGAAGVGWDGPVIVDAGGCVAVRGAALVGLPGSRLNPDGTFTLADPGGGVRAVTLRVGDRFRWGGTPADSGADWARAYLPDGADTCGSSRYLLVFGG